MTAGTVTNPRLVVSGRTSPISSSGTDESVLVDLQPHVRLCHSLFAPMLMQTSLQTVPASSSQLMIMIAYEMAGDAWTCVLNLDLLLEFSFALPCAGGSLPAAFSLNVTAQIRTLS